MIISFQGEYRWLSNFAACNVVLDSVVYPTTENAYQAAKTTNLSLRREFQYCTPRDAKRLGRKLKYRNDWDTVKLQVMADLNRQKYNQEPFRSKLLATGTVWIEEGNTWGDTFWGVSDGVGQNRLGRLIMGLRRELRGESNDY